MNIFSVLHRLNQTALFWTIASTGLRAMGLFLAIPVMLFAMPSWELGLWYVFSSLAGFSALLDFGFCYSVTQSAGYVWAGAPYLRTEGLHFNEAINSGPNYPLLSRLVATMQLYYQLLSIIVLSLLLTFGSWWIWQKTLGLPHANSLRFAWVVFSVGVAYNVNGSLWPSLLSGINGVRQAQQIFLGSLIINYLTLVGGLLAGWGMWSLVLSQILMGIVQRHGGRVIFMRLVGPNFTSEKVDWDLLNILWPMASRYAVIGFAGLLVPGGIALAVSIQLGLAATASYGISMQAITALSGVSLAWITVKIPYINQLRAQNRLRELTIIFVSRTRFTLLSYFLGGVVLLSFGQSFLQFEKAKTSFLPTLEFAAFIFIYLIDVNRICYEIIVLSKNENPFVFPVFFSALGVLLLSIILIPFWGMWGIALSYLIAQFSFNYWWTVICGIRSLKLKSNEYCRKFVALTK